MSHIIRQMLKDEYKTGKSRKYYERKVAYLKKHGLFNNETFEHKIVKFDRSQAVSYTHLDVYKRQQYAILKQYL